MIPFMTEDIYQNLVRSVDGSAPVSIHLCDFPKYNAEYIDEELEKNMEYVLDIVVLGRSCRNTANIKNRQPIGKMFVNADRTLDNFYTEIIADELNVKKVEFTDDTSALTSYTFKPQLKTLGRRFGKNIGLVKNILAELDGNKAMSELNETGKLTINVDGIDEELEKDDLLIESAQKEGYVSDSDYGITVALETNLSEELIEEGFVREIISKIQTMRKDSGFEVMDNIKIYENGSAKLEEVMEKNAETIKSETLAKEFVFAAECDGSKEWNINGEKVKLGVERV